MIEFRPRLNQERVLAYTGGRMGIAAVPGSGKTHTLAELAARLVADGIAEGQEVLVVTLVNSAVDNLKGRIDLAIRRRKLLPGFGYRVRTLHGLAHDIVRERPALVGLAEDFGIIDEQAAEALLHETVTSWLGANPDAGDPYLQDGLEPGRLAWVKRNRWPGLVYDVAAAFIKRAKDLEATPEQLQLLLTQAVDSPRDRQALPHLGMASMATAVYADYQRSLAYRGVVDFDDLVRLALAALRRDPDFLGRLQLRWPFVLEDEAQDSSLLQEEILRHLTARTNNWVRVGDPNQAIYETFTTADPDLLLRFLREPAKVRAESLPVSGRSQPSIIQLANGLVDWVRTEHPALEVRDALIGTQILPTSLGDPQPNPPDDPGSVRLVVDAMAPDRELHFVADLLAHWYADQGERAAPDQETCAVLAPTNHRGSEMASLLKARAIPYVELLRSTAATRETAGALALVLRSLADPTSPGRLAQAFRVWRRSERALGAAELRTQSLARAIAQCPRTEAFLWPRAGESWIDQLPDLTPEDASLLADFRSAASRWHRAAELPIAQLVLTLAGELFPEPVELALAYKLSLLLEDTAEAHPAARLPELVQELEVIARNQRRFLGFSSDDNGFVPPRGKVTVTTMHKAKGLEWDSVYLLSVNNYDFPSGQSHDFYRDEPGFIRGQLNLREEALGFLVALVARCEGAEVPLPGVGEATERARLRYVAERLRLLYVGITRAKRALTITSNTGRRSGAGIRPATPLLALRGLSDATPSRAQQDG